MKMELIKSESRGKAEHGWLHSNFSFSFSEYYNPARMGFGLLRVLNDDIIEPGKGFGFHPHNNMEIVSIPLAGMLEHRDSMSNTSVIQAGDVQIMSAGKGVVHSEYNPSKTEAGNFLQIWIQPKEKNIEPRYQQMRMYSNVPADNLAIIVSPISSGDSVWINQDAYLLIGKYKESKNETYSVQHPGNGVYLFVIEGKIVAGDIEVNKRDALQVCDTDSFDFTVEKDSHILIIDVPME